MNHPVVDIHAHIYPTKIAPRAVDAVGDFYNYKMFASDAPEGIVSGSAEHLIASASESPISHFVVHSVAVRPGTVESINNFIASECQARSNFIGFMAMHQDYENPEKEIERALGLGLRGMKIHPDTQQVDLDDPRLMKVYEILEARHIPLILHVGDYRYDYSHPRRLKRVLHEFPDLVVDAAHFGGWSVFDMATEWLEGENCFMDLSSAMAFLGDRRTRELIRFYGSDRVMFGSDFPMWSPTSEYEITQRLGLTEDEYENIYWHNAERFIGMKIE